MKPKYRQFVAYVSPISKQCCVSSILRINEAQRVDKFETNQTKDCIPIIMFCLNRIKFIY